MEPTATTATTVAVRRCERIARGSLSIEVHQSDAPRCTSAENGRRSRAESLLRDGRSRGRLQFKRLANNDDVRVRRCSRSRRPRRIVEECADCAGRWIVLWNSIAVGVPDRLHRRLLSGRRQGLKIDQGRHRKRQRSRGDEREAQSANERSVLVQRIPGLGRV